MPFAFTEQEIPGVVLIEPKIFGDDRGHFFESFSRVGFGPAGLPIHFVQENQSLSHRGVLRGLHFQRAPKAQAKLVRVIAGEIYDVAVDIRPDSPTRGQWVSAVLSSENHLQLFIPAGFAHGFCVLSETAEVTYMVTDDYSPQHEDGLMWNDPDLAISWPVENPIVAPRDQQWPRFSAMEAGVR
jgi:dTDP-4-dehydrorhamnose 3,5-epimerase